MGLLDWLKRRAGGGRPDAADTAPARYDAAELARRLDWPLAQLQATPVGYNEFQIPKRRGGTRTIAAPIPELKRVQRRINRRLLARLPAHSCATGFERGHSIVTNAVTHARQPVVVRMDLRDFFGSTRADRVRRYFRIIGWDDESADLLVRLCTHQGRLPQGAATSPRLSNLVNIRLDARLEGMARRLNVRCRDPQARPSGLAVSYSRYADDLTFSFSHDDRTAIAAVIRQTKAIVADEGYRLHQKRKLHIRRRHQQQRVTGLVVNDGVRLPRDTRRWLRAVEHRVATGRDCTLSPQQLAGWRALAHMVRSQAASV